MAYKVDLTQFIISSISINTDPTQLNNLQKAVSMNNEFSFTCRPPVDASDTTVMVECNFKIRSDTDALAVDLSSSGIFQFDSVPDNWIESVKEHCTHPMIDACMARVQNILKEMGMTLNIE